MINNWTPSSLTAVADMSKVTLVPNDKVEYNYVGLENIESNTSKLVDFSPTLGEMIKSTKVSFRKGDVLYGKLRPYLNKVWIADFDGIATTEIIPFRCNSLKITNKFFAYFLQTPSYLTLVNQNCSGARMPRITTRFLESIAKIPVPPLPEQNRIVKKLDTLFEQIDKAIALCEENIQHTKALMASVLNKSFSVTWELKPLSEITNVISGYAFKSTDFSDNTGIRSIKITNVGVGSFVGTNSDYLPKPFLKSYSNFIANENDIAVALTRSFINDGLKVCRVPEEYNDSLVNQRVAVLKHVDGGSNLDYVYHFLRSPSVLEYVKDKSKSLNQPNLSIKDLGALLVPSPDLTTQTEIANKISKLLAANTSLLSELNSKLSHLKILKSSLLDQAFKGEL